MKKGLLVIAVIAAAVVVSGMRKPSKATEYREYIVHSGDTLWSISQEITPPSRDLRYTVAEIEEENDVESGLIYAGQVISVPVYEEK